MMLSQHEALPKQAPPLVVAAPVLSPGHLYDFSMRLILPESPINDNIGAAHHHHPTSSGLADIS